MKQVMDGKLFDTEFAAFIGERSYGSRGDFRHVEETLYRTPKSGEYFLAGRGGPLSRYANEVEPGSYQGGAGIIPLSLAEAIDWASEHLDVETVLAEFGEHIEET